MEKSNPEIICMERIFDDTNCVFFYRVVVYFEKVPDLKLGKCEVRQ